MSDCTCTFPSPCLDHKGRAYRVLHGLRLYAVVHKVFRFDAQLDRYVYIGANNGFSPQESLKAVCQDRGTYIVTTESAAYRFEIRHNGVTIHPLGS